MKINESLRAQVKAAKGTHREVAKRFGISKGSVSRIKNESSVQNGAMINVVSDKQKPTSIGVVSNDWQVPFHDEGALELFFHFCRRIRPNWIDLNGDIFDFYQVSNHQKDPKRKAELQDDLNILLGYLKRLRKENPDAIIWYEIGNHEQRLRKFLWRGAPEISSLDCLQFENLLKLKQLGIIPIENWRREGDLYIMHGTIVRKNAGYTAKATFEKYGVTMIIGHSHRDGKYTRRTLDGHKAVWENYCLCQLDNIEYCDFPDWCQGFSKVTMIKDRPLVEQIPIINKEYTYNNRRYKYKKGKINEKPE